MKIAHTSAHNTYSPVSANIGPQVTIFLQFHIISPYTVQLSFSVNHGLTCTTHTEILDNTKLIMSHYNKPLCVLSLHSQIHL